MQILFQSAMTSCFKKKKKVFSLLKMTVVSGGGVSRWKGETP
jgi:hypothetical protein